MSLSLGEWAIPVRSVLLCATLAAACLLSCSGGQADTATSWGQSATNTRVTATLDAGIYETPSCSVTDLSASASLATETIDPDLPENTLALDSYLVSYDPVGSTSPDLSPASHTLSSSLPAESLAVVLADAGRLAAAGAGASYTATVTFSGHDAYGSQWGASASALVKVEADGACALEVSPDTLALTALANPDGDERDDVAFSISGGTPPYAVYSDDADVIAQPGALGPGVSSFTVDPDAPGAPAEVTLSVLDSAGALSTARLSVSAGAGVSTGFAIAPGSVAATALANPDGDLADDVTFYLSGGTPPYTVYSNAGDAVGSPGPLDAAATSFTVDPDAVATTTIVTLTAVDSVGATAASDIVLAASAGGGLALSLSPTAIALSALANPDNDASDDVTFAVLGGTGPYTVYSSDAGVVAAPGALGDGVASFTLDPDGVADDTDVTVTVLDSAGASATARVSVLPSSAAALSLSPASLVLAAWPNPDGDAADDLTFRVSGGTPPYKVYSEDAEVLDLTGYEVGADGTFIVDPNPDPAGGAVEVALSVIDAAQGVATAMVTVVPRP